jgi:hypothetical protein
MPSQPLSSSNGAGIALGFVLIIIGIAAYWVPTIVVLARHSPQGHRHVTPGDRLPECRQSAESDWRRYSGVVEHDDTVRDASDGIRANTGFNDPWMIL